MSAQIQLMKDDLSPVFMWCKMDKERCESLNQRIIVETGGAAIEQNRICTTENFTEIEFYCYPCYKF